MKRITNETVLITGGSSGIGFEMAKKLVEKGNTVIICGRSEKKLAQCKAKVPQLHTIQCDITSEKDRKDLFHNVQNRFPDLSIFVNNAGIVKRYYLEDSNSIESHILDELHTNYTAPVFLTKLFLPIIKKNRGTFVNVTSGLAFVPLHIQATYCATKAALHSFSQSIREQLKKSNVKVIEIAYPAVDTPFQNGESTVEMIKAETAAEEAINGLEHEKELILVKKSALLYTLSRIMPRKVFQILNRAVPKNAREKLKQVYA
jgi:uncharacterized oxidoreductase